LQRDAAMIRDLYAKEEEVNALQVEVDDQAVKLTVLHQPVAQDARFLFMASRIGGELERIADQAINVCQNAQHVGGEPAMKPMLDLPMMATLARRMVRQSLSAMMDGNVPMANSVLEKEKELDTFKDQVFRSLLTYMMSDPRTISQALSMILISRNLERVGDHATNISEEVIYWIQGRDVRHGRGLEPTEAEK